LTNRGFLKSIFELIEANHENDEFISTSIKFLLSFNLRFDYPHNNPVLLTLVEINEQISSRELIERLILLFNRDSKINFLSNRVELRGIGVRYSAGRNSVRIQPSLSFLEH
jgi:hypothetical protein